MAGKKVNRLIVPNVYTVNGVEPVTSVNNILPVNGNVTIPIPTVPTNVSAFYNDAGYLTSTTLDGYATQSWVQQQGYLTSASLSTLTDVALSNPTQGQNLTYDAAVGKWKNTSTTAAVTWGDITGTLADQTDLNIALSEKQAALVSGRNIKTINNTSMLGSGNIDTSEIFIAAYGTTTLQEIYTAYNAGYTVFCKITDILDFKLASLVRIVHTPFGVDKKAVFSYCANNKIYTYTVTDEATWTTATENIPTHITDGTNTVTASNNGTVNISTLLPDVSNFVTNSSLATTLSSYATQQWAQQQASSLYASMQTWVQNQGYTTNVGTVTSVNNTQPDANGNVTLIIPDTATWGNITGTLSDQTDLQTALDAKQNTILDLSTIRSGASLGATALQPNDNITELVNNAGYITGITSSDVTTALGYTPYNSTNPNGYQANVIETIKVNNTAQTVTNKAVNITVPTNTNQLTNGAGFITGITSSNVTTALGYTPSNNTLSNVSSIDSSSAVATALDGKVNTDLSNLSATGKTVIDGQWVWTVQNILSDASLKNSSKTPLPKTVTLPNNNYAYEVMIRGRVTTGTTSGNYLRLQMASAVNGSGNGSTVFCCSARTRSASAVEAQGTVIVPNMKYGTNNLIIMRDANFNGTADLDVIGYRRMGTNT